MNDVQLAGRLYAVYCEAVGGKAFNGDPLPDWPEFVSDPNKRKQSEAWIRVAQAAQAGEQEEEKNLGVTSILVGFAGIVLFCVVACPFIVEGIKKYWNWVHDLFY